MNKQENVIFQLMETAKASAEKLHDKHVDIVLDYVVTTKTTLPAEEYYNKYGNFDLMDVDTPIEDVRKDTQAYLDMILRMINPDDFDSMKDVQTIAGAMFRVVATLEQIMVEGI